jgi:hypothetical protein
MTRWIVNDRIARAQMKERRGTVAAMADVIEAPSAQSLKVMLKLVIVSCAGLLAVVARRRWKDVGDELDDGIRRAS